MYNYHLECQNYIAGTLLPGKGDEAYRTRINSGYVRELIRGNFLIKYEEITQLDNVGQGYVCMYWSISNILERKY